MRASPETVMKDATPPMSEWLPWVVPAKSDAPVILDYDLYGRVASAWQAHMGQMPMQGIETLPKTDLFMAFGHAGSLSCLSAMFVVAKPGGAMRVLDFPPGLRPKMSACGLENQSGGLATVLRRPAYIESGLSIGAMRIRCCSSCRGRARRGANRVLCRFVSGTGSQCSYSIAAPSGQCAAPRAKSHLPWSVNITRIRTIGSTLSISVFRSQRSGLGVFRMRREVGLWPERAA